MEKRRGSCLHGHLDQGGRAAAVISSALLKVFLSLLKESRKRNWKLEVDEHSHPISGFLILETQ